MTMLEPCGCFSDDVMQIAWPCAVHRGQTEAQRADDDAQQAIEAIAMNDWIAPDAPDR